MTEELDWLKGLVEQGVTPDEAREKFAAIVERVETLEEALGYISRMRAFHDGAINIVTLTTAINIAKNALNGIRLGPIK